MTAGSDSRRSFLRQTIVLGAAATTALGASPTYADADVDAGADPDAVREIWLAPGGDDGGPGTRKRPFRTLLRAQQAVREATGAGQDAIVVLRGGSYELTETLRFLPADGGGVGVGVGGRKVRYRAAPGERPVISGGRTLTAWQVHDSAKGIWRTVEDNPLLDAASIPARAKAIAADAGVQRAYRDLLPGGLPAPPPVEAVCDPQYAGQPPLGPPWTP